MVKVERFLKKLHKNRLITLNLVRRKYFFLLLNKKLISNSKGIVLIFKTNICGSAGELARKTPRNLLHGALLPRYILFVHRRVDCASIHRAGCTLWNYGTRRTFSCRRAIAMTLSLRREHSQFLRSAIRRPPINAFAPSDKSDEPAAGRCI